MDWLFCKVMKWAGASREKNFGRMPSDKKIIYLLFSATKSEICKGHSKLSKRLNCNR